MRDVAATTSTLLGLTDNAAASRAKLFMHGALVSILNQIDEEALVAACLHQLRAILGWDRLDLLARRVGALDAHGMLRIADICTIASPREQWEILAAAAPGLSFRYSLNGNPAAELQGMVDAAINGEIVVAAINGLKASLARGSINEAVCAGIADEISAANGTALVNPVFIAAVERELMKLVATYGPAGPIHILSIGCGRGNNDSQLYTEISARHPMLDIVMVGFDPHQSIADNPIVTQCGGILINRELAPRETYLAALRQETGMVEPLAIATERYALHHMHRTIDTLLDDVEDIALISVDHPITERQRLDLTERAAMIAYDLMSAQVRTARSGGTWIPTAMSNPKVFNILYQREIDIMRAPGVRLDPVFGKMPPTAIITHPAGRRQTQRAAAE